MDEGEPIDITAMRAKAIEAQAELTALAALYSLAIRASEAPDTIAAAEVRILAEGILRHVKPHIKRR